MRLYSKPVTVTDLPRCIELAGEPIRQIAARFGTDPAGVFGDLLRTNRLNGATIFDQADPSKILGFGTGFFISDLALQKALSGDLKSVLTGMLSGTLPATYIADLRAQEKGHLGDGLNLYSCFSGWIDDRPAIKTALARSVEIDLSGLNLKSSYKEIYDPAIAKGYARFFGLPVHPRPKLTWKLGDPILVGTTREAWSISEQPGQPVNDWFDPAKPRLLLGRSQRRILQMLLLKPSLTNTALADQLALSADHVRKEVIKAFHAVFADQAVSGEKGMDESKRRQIIEYLRMNPQDMRPWVVWQSQLSAAV